jgi:hypothetical protein
MTMAPPRLVLDPTGSDVANVTGAFTYSDPTKTFELLGRHDTLRFVPAEDPLDVATYEPIYEAAWAALVPDPDSKLRRVPNLYIWADEAGVILPAQKRNKKGSRFIYAGRKLGTGHMACHTRPREVDLHVKTDAQMMVLFDTADADDRAHLARCMGVPLAVLENAWAACPVDPPPTPDRPPLRGPLVWDKPRRRLTPYPPLRLV